jgi:hypothetical protein
MPWTSYGTAHDPEEALRFWRLRALRAQVIADEEALRGRARASYVKAERVLAAAIGADLGLPLTALVPASRRRRR